ncbi:hypothetical protein, partial [Limimaricola cinnabarinus]
MISCTRIYNVAYYLASTELADQEAAAGQKAADRAPTTMTGAVSRDRQDADPCDGPGRWVVLQP